MEASQTKSCRSFDNHTTDSTEEFLPLLMNRKRSAAMLSISVRGLDYLIADGSIRARRLGGRVLVPTKELRRFAETDRPEPLVPVAAPVSAAA